MLGTELPADELLRRPLWQARDLGLPIPASTHAVSVALPRWQDVVGYEEKRPEVIERLSMGYPRFVVHPLVQELGRYLGLGSPCLPFPSAASAELAAGFVRRTADLPAKVISRGEAFGVATNADGLIALRAFWQHTGLI